MDGTIDNIIAIKINYYWHNCEYPHELSCSLTFIDFLIYFVQGDKRESFSGYSKLLTLSPWMKAQEK